MHKFRLSLDSYRNNAFTKFETEMWKTRNMLNKST